MAQSKTSPAIKPHEEPPATADLPLFYREIAVVEAARHAGKSLKTAISLDFSRATNVVMLNVAEFEVAARFYPIVFTSAPNPAALAVLGVRQSENLFLDAKGDWKPATYIPAYVRRYPFIFHRSGDGQQYTLCIDEASGALENGSARPLFVDGAPSETAKLAFDFCAAYQRDNDATREFVSALAAEGVLVPNQAQIKLPSGEALSVGGFEVIDRAKFEALPTFIISNWHKRGWLTAIAAHFISLAAFGDLVAEASKKR